MNGPTTALVVVGAVLLLVMALSIRVVKQYERGVLFRLGRVVGARDPGLRLLVPVIDVLHRVSLRVVTMPIQSHVITRDNVSVDVSAVAYFRVVDAVKSVVAIENVHAAINQIAQTTLRKVVGRHTLDETLSETDKINQDIRAILDVTTVEWGVEVTLVELKDIQLPDAMMAHPLALQLRNLQSLVEIGVDKNTTVVFPAPLMSTIGELGTFLAHEASAATAVNGPSPVPVVAPRNGVALSAVDPDRAPA
jgi:regulator of protease activity HflC (stomatin/prohibitin superfamily)